MLTNENRACFNKKNIMDQQEAKIVKELMVIMKNQQKYNCVVP